jgi:hypothetical protein
MSRRRAGRAPTRRGKSRYIDVYVDKEIDLSIGLRERVGGFVTPSAVALIGRKRDGGALSAAEIDWLISAYLRDEVDDAQMAAFLMAGVLRGFSDDEAAALTETMVETGRSIDLSILAGRRSTSTPLGAWGMSPR